MTRPGVTRGSGGPARGWSKRDRDDSSSGSTRGGTTTDSTSLVERATLGEAFSWSSVVCSSPALFEAIEREQERRGNT